jgi:hypothetical protein
MCIEFPYEKGKLAPYIYDLCIMYKEARKKTRRTRRKKEKKCSGKK